MNSTPEHIWYEVLSKRRSLVTWTFIKVALGVCSEIVERIFTSFHIFNYLR